MEEEKTKVYVTLDTTHHTWNVMSMDNQCLYFNHNIDKMEDWLDKHKDKYQEQAA